MRPRRREVNGSYRRIFFHEDRVLELPPVARLWVALSCGPRITLDKRRAVLHAGLRSPGRGIGRECGTRKTKFQHSSNTEIPERSRPKFCWTDLYQLLLTVHDSLLLYSLSRLFFTLKMLLYEDIVTGDEMFSDAFPMCVAFTCGAYSRLTPGRAGS